MTWDKLKRVGEVGPMKEIILRNISLGISSMWQNWWFLSWILQGSVIAILQLRALQDEQQLILSFSGSLVLSVSMFSLLLLWHGEMELHWEDLLIYPCSVELNRWFIFFFIQSQWLMFWATAVDISICLNLKTTMLISILVRTEVLYLNLTPTKVIYDWLTFHFMNCSIIAFTISISPFVGEGR